ncbi:hypothetical protein B0I27_106197 [Arcticibacter pallidicorallinus]|uniref:FG-GAP repeat protein n=1 Tax=Arcticibacter pallidicorallinus TaxID=1259464 RepID=A0A2T0U3E8_9SPHI|nr:hypothetical protein [Arcticibacter pallidicorallinus]PRY52436.1 hypothetical protein B0I27_106197 [Arcticibacter pallidicorallinus]
MKLTAASLASIKFLVFTLFPLAMVSSCNSADEKKELKPETRVVLPEPFRAHKVVEVRPGLTFDILSWGRGSQESGAFLILRSDSSAIEYRSVSAELEGKITDAWNMDLDSDGNPEIFVQAMAGSTNDNLMMYVYEFSDNGSAREIRFPDLTSATKKQYKGKDSVYVKEGSLFREFPLFESGDTSAAKAVGKKKLEYLLRGNSFSIKEHKED